MDSVQKMNQDAINQQEWENPANWSDTIVGLYFSKKDSRVWVPKRIPALGWTLNLAHRAGAFWFLFLMLLPTFVVVLVLIFIVFARP